MSRPIITVVGSDISKTTEQQQARDLGAALATEGWIVLTGGRVGKQGTTVMHLALEGAKSVKNSITVGVFPGQEADTQTSPKADVPIYTGMGNARNLINVLSGNVIIAFGKVGAGTASEIALSLKAGKPVVLYKVNKEAVALFKTLGKPHAVPVRTLKALIIQVKKYVSPSGPWPCSDKQ